MLIFHSFDHTDVGNNLLQQHSLNSKREEETTNLNKNNKATNSPPTYPTVDIDPTVNQEATESDPGETTKGMGDDMGPSTDLKDDLLDTDDTTEENRKSGELSPYQFAKAQGPGETTIEERDGGELNINQDLDDTAHGSDIATVEENEEGELHIIQHDSTHTPDETADETGEDHPIDKQKESAQMHNSDNLGLKKGIGAKIVGRIRKAPVTRTDDFLWSGICKKNTR
jgi:hypothetical protein